MDNQKYNVGDEIFFEGAVYIVQMKVEHRYIIKSKVFGTYFGVPREEIENSARPIENQKEEINMQKTNVSDDVNHPSYYQGKIEVIDFIEDKHLGFNLGNCVKYISRCHLKHKDNPVEDLKKARWYLDREIKNMEVNHG